ncbi:MAG: phosphohistidine phosphatase SixA [Anaerolineae bacterium]
MRLYFFRHGEAEDTASDDYARKLTERGAARVATAAKVLAKLGVKPKHIYSSPRTRAKQTAELLAKALGVAVEEREEVNYDFDLKLLEKLLADADAEDEIILVGHEPTFSNTLRDLTGGEVEMKKGGCARVDAGMQPMLHGTLVWLIAPKVFDVLGS